MDFKWLRPIAEALTPFKQYRGRYEADISHGYEEGRPDWAVVRDDDTDTGVVAVKIDEYFAAYDYKDFMSGETFVLITKKCGTPEDAYFKLMKFLGKMMKKDNNPRNRYLHKHRDREYEEFGEIFTEEILQDIRSKNTI